MKLKKIVISLLAFSLLIFNVPIYAETIDNYRAIISTDKDNVNKGEEITITISLKDINIESGEKGIGAYTANLDFDSSVLEYISSEGTNKWEAPNYHNGKIVGNTKDGTVMTEEGSIGTIKFKVKEDAPAKEITVSLMNFSGSNAVNDIKASDYSINVMIKDDNSGNTGDDSQGGNGSEETNGNNEQNGSGSQGTNGNNEQNGSGSQGTNGNNEQNGSGSQGTNGNNEQNGSGSQGTNGNNEQSGSGSEGTNGNNEQNGSGSQGTNGNNEQSGSGSQETNGDNEQDGNQNVSKDKDNSNGTSNFPNSLPRTGENGVITYLIAGGISFFAIALCLEIKLLKLKK